MFLQCSIAASLQSKHKLHCMFNVLPAFTIDAFDFASPLCCLTCAMPGVIRCALHSAVRAGLAQGVLQAGAGMVSLAKPHNVTCV